LRPDQCNPTLLEGTHIYKCTVRLCVKFGDSRLQNAVIRDLARHPPPSAPGDQPLHTDLVVDSDLHDVEDGEDEHDQVDPVEVLTRGGD
jgi:hypothetical protein